MNICIDALNICPLCVHTINIQGPCFSSDDLGKTILSYMNSFMLGFFFVFNFA